MRSTTTSQKRSRPVKAAANSLKLRETLGLSRAILARLLKVSENTIFRWDIGKVTPDAISKEKIEQLSKICELLKETNPELAIAPWLEQPHQELENFRPIDLIDSEFGRRRLHQVVERMGKIKLLPLPIRRTIFEFRDRSFPKLLREIQLAAGFEIPIEVHWEQLALHGRPLEQYQDSFEKGLFAPLVKAFKAITVDDLGKQALKESLKKVVIAEKSSKATDAYEFENGILKVSNSPAVFYAEVQRHTDDLRKVLEANL